MRKASLIRLRVDMDEKAAFEEAASLSGLSLSAWVRERLRRVAIRELEEASRPVAFIRFERK